MVRGSSMNVSFETQELTYGSPGGPRKIPAPANWKFDRSATIAWVWLVSTTRKLDSGEIKTIRERRYHEGQIRAFALVLANSLGMALPYWQDRAAELAKVWK